MVEGLPEGVRRNSPNDVVSHVPRGPLYGLGESWAGPRWVAGVSGPDPLPTLSLGHLSDDHLRGAIVSTVWRSRTPSTDFRTTVGRPRALAQWAADRLLEATWPNPERMRSERWLDAVDRYVEQQVQAHASWPSVKWFLRSRSVDAAVWRFAGGWTGFTTDLPDADVVVTAIGVPYSNVELVRVSDGAPYGFAIDRNITIDQMGVGARLPSPNTADFHPDHLALRSR